MQVLVVSDSHGHTGYLWQAVELVQPDHILHLGDGFGDMQLVREHYPNISITQVPGNCDIFADAPRETTITLDGVKLFLCHGHTRGVKSTMQAACYAAQEQGANVLLYGHTHCPSYERYGDLDVFNPGSIGYDGRYGILTIAQGTVTCKLHSL